MMDLILLVAIVARNLTQIKSISAKPAIQYIKYVWLLYQRPLYNSVIMILWMYMWITNAKNFFNCLHISGMLLYHL
jgi:hypothetical protein